MRQRSSHATAYPNTSDAPRGQAATRAGSGDRGSLSTRIGLALVAGIAVGLIVGERASVLQIAADAYIKLLQMTVLPYVTISIIGGLGALNAAQARALGLRVGLVLALVWVFALAAVCLFPLMFPPRVSASFFSTTLIEGREPFGLLDLYIPENPFHSLANNIVPAVVLFSIIVGAALTTIPEKAPLLAVLDLAGQAVSKATRFVVALTPLGVFAIAAVFSGTLSLEELERLEVYLLSYAAMALLLSLWVLPGLVAALTPVPYRTLLSRTRDALVMAFMTTSLFAVLPLLIEHAKSLLRDYGDPAEAARTDVIVPASFNFPHAGKLLSLSFLLFAGWYADTRVSFADYPRLAGAGVLAMFGSINAAVPFLLDMFHIPADTFPLFVASAVVNSRFGTLVAATHTLAVAILGSCAVAGLLTFDGWKIARFAAITILLTTGVVAGTRGLLAYALKQPYEQDTLVTHMAPLRDRGTARVSEPGDEVAPLPAVTTSVLDRVRQRGGLRVGFFGDSLPFAFVNAHGALVGFDIEMAYQLARDLGVELELLPMTRTVLETGLDPAVCDMVMSGVAMTATRAGRLLYSASYLDETVAFVVADDRAAAFSQWSTVRAMRSLRLAVPREPYFVQKIQDELTNAEIVPVDSLDDIFGAQAPKVDALVATAERGSAYTLLHPEYSVAVPQPRPFRVPLAYLIAGRDAELAAMVNTWIELKRKDGTIDQLFAHWILGQDDSPRERRWNLVDHLLQKPTDSANVR